MKDAFVVLDVGHGNSAVLINGGVTVVIDTGQGAILLEFLREQEIKHIDTILLSHADTDHIGGLIGLLASDTVSVGVVRANTDSAKTSSTWDDLVFELSQNPGIDFQPILTTESTGDFNTTDVEIEIVAPSTYLASKGPGSVDRKGRTLGTNSNSGVIRLLYGGNPFALLPGDVDIVGLQNIVEQEKELNAKIVVFPHHGGRAGAGDLASFVNDFMRAASPEIVFFSIGRGRHSTPRPEVVNAVRELGPRVQIACTQISENCLASITRELDQSHLTDSAAAGKKNGHCCAGTLIFDFINNECFPSLPRHREFVREEADTPLCIPTEL
ncbi:ComEC/Rec2 family competence protein [Bremerella sp. T1]|uniref:ComEC/Rec2 family competence protein n=1 Tax=Bremerella sp. TYQ1 TaxID=3119568 RepID=UPI001CC9834F|nr:MBL fold metallo-hydrolase [Bremerella volcania]UBM38440.1 MBL fold metallo-hydrolase [Bremerella volcania]